MYLCFTKSNILGVATNKEKAEEMCYELGDSYYLIEPNKCTREYKDITKFCTYKTTLGFLNYNEILEKAKEIAEEKYNNVSSLTFQEFVPIFEKILGDCTEIFLRKYKEVNGCS